MEEEYVNVVDLTVSDVEEDDEASTSRVEGIEVINENSGKSSPQKFKGVKMYGKRAVNSKVDRLATLRRLSKNDSSGLDYTLHYDPSVLETSFDRLIKA